MRKHLLFFLALLFVSAGFAQNRATLLQESFDGSSMPAGWSIQGLGTTNWTISPTNKAGGTPNEMKLDWSPQFNGVSRLVTPEVDLTGISSVVVSFKHSLDNYTGTNTIGVATSSDNGATWNDGWTHGYSNSTSYEVSEIITTPDMGNANVKFCIYFTGNAYNINDWYFDDILIFSQENLDLAITGTTLPAAIGAGSIEFGVKVYNYGVEPITSVEASYYITNGANNTETFVVNIPSLSSDEITFTIPQNLTPGDYDIMFMLNSINGGDDDDPSNDMFETTLSVAVGSVDKIPMIEHFSSSTCGPCVSVNSQMLNFCNQNPGRFTYTKYQMSWPSPGDPYYTEEGGVRRVYYGVNAVPQCFLDGEDQGYATIAQVVFDQHAALPAFFDIRGSFVVEGTEVHIIADVMPYITTDARVFISVNEKETVGNVGSNGETSFHHIFMKMVTPTDGEMMNFVAGNPQRLEFTQDMQGTHVEEMNDLEVSIWVQNYGTMEVYNSRFAYENAAHPYAVQNLMLTEDDETGMATATWETPAEGTPEGYNIYLNGELVAENTIATEYAFPVENGNYYTVEVQALYSDMTSIKAMATLTSTLNVADSDANICSLYPNPANDKAIIESNETIRTIAVYNILGALVESNTVDNNRAQLNLNGWSNGIYLVNVTLANGNSMTYRLAVTK